MLNPVPALVPLLLLTFAHGAAAQGKFTPPASFSAPLAIALPAGVELTSWSEKDGVVMLTGRARSFDDVSEFMRGLNNVTRCPRGLARVVERKRNGGFLRVELVEGRREVLEYPRNQVHFFFAGLELKSTEASAQREVGFTLFFPVVTEDRPPR